MSGNVEIEVGFPLDENGMIGRECPECKEYFKLKFGTGLPTTICNCPYCGHEDDGRKFFTQDQVDYIHSILRREVIAPALRKFRQSLSGLEHRTRGNLVQIKVSSHPIDFPIKYYSERDLETLVICDNCGLHFAIFGVFAGCPDCKRLTTMSVFTKSLEVARKRLGLVDNIPENESDIKQALLVDTLVSVVAAFDGLGKRIRNDFPNALPQRPRNLFQNLDALNASLTGSFSTSLEQLLGLIRYERMYKLFQVCHLWDHNFGEIDEDFIKKTKCSHSLLRTKYQVTKQEVADLLDLVEEAGTKIRALLK
jgi:Zn ribbon nucleic-acid-binding protein